MVTEAGGGGDVIVEVVNGLPLDTLVEASRSTSLLVCGTRGIGGFRGMLMGSVSRRLVAEAACPVVCVPD